ncbi:MAG: 3-hydroxybutyrate dehydrogenase [Candidatus Puniceispirillaceae bacterium]
MRHHILITGATSGIGQAIAMAAAKQKMAISFTGIEAPEAGEVVAQRLLENGADEARYFQVDLSHAEAARDVVGRIMSGKKRLDMVVNNAGIQHVAAIEDFDPHAWDKVLAVNLSAPFHIMAASLPIMKQAGFGRIVNIASVHGLVASACKSAYVAAKHGIIGLTKTAALETAQMNITCNAICPGWVRTPLVEAQIEARAKEKGCDVEEEARLLVSEKQPSGQFVTPEQIAKMTLFLLSEEAETITGSHFVMDGGWTAQ